MFGGDEIGSLVGEFGHSSFRLGFSGEDFPKILLPATFGRRGPEVFAGRNQKFPRPGMEIENLLDEQGKVRDFQAFHETFKFAMAGLNCQPPDHPLLIVEPANLAREERERQAAELFEHEEFPALYFGRAPVLACFATGRSSGLVVDCGFSHTEVAPVADGFLITKGLRNTAFAGQTLDKIAEILFSNKSSLVPAELLQPLPCPLADLTASYRARLRAALLSDICESVCKVSEVPLSLASAKFPLESYELPDRTRLDVGNERFLLPEHYFNPAINISPETTQIVQQTIQQDALAQNGQKFSGLASLVDSSLQACDPDLRKEFSSSLVVCGGHSLYAGFSSRVASEVNNALNGAIRVKVTHSSANPHQVNRHLSWIGGSILSSLGTFHQLWISKQEYQEQGNRILHKKCN